LGIPPFNPFGLTQMCRFSDGRTAVRPYKWRGLRKSYMFNRVLHYEYFPAELTAPGGCAD